MLRRHRLPPLVLALALLAAGCGERAAVPEAVPQAPAAPVAEALAVKPVDELRARAAQALQDRRLHAPAGDNAIEYYLALRGRDGGNPAEAAALTDLQPYALIAAEQAMAGGDTGEAARLIDLIARVDPQAPALPRLHADLETLRRAIARQEEIAAEDAAADRQAPPPAPAAAVQAAAAPPPATPPPPPAPPPPAVAAGTPAAPPPGAQPSPAPAPAARPLPAAAERPPALVEEVPPRYPMAALNRRLEGNVVVAFTIAPDGRVVDPRVRSASPPGVFDRAALAAVTRWRFEATGRSHQATRNLSFSLDTASGGSAR